MSRPKKRFRITGLGVERLIEHLSEKGFQLYDVSRTDLRTMDISCDENTFQSIADVAVERGFSVCIMPSTPQDDPISFLKKRKALIILLGAALLLIYFSTRFVWGISIENAGAYTGEVRKYLAENSFTAGMHKSSIDLKLISDELTYRLPRTAWVRCRYKGLRLVIEVTQGIPSPDVQSAGAPGNLIASCSGVVESLTVFAGTPAVQAGETVKEGDVLIYGYEKRADESVVSVRARGEALSRIYINESAAVSCLHYESIRTGRSSSRTMICFPFVRFSLADTPDYLTSESESKRIDSPGAWVPVWFERETHYEVYLEETSADTDAVKAEVARLAMRKLLQKCAENDEIIDKWLDYSMIEGGIILARATAEIRRDIAVFSSETPD